MHARAAPAVVMAAAIALVGVLGCGDDEPGTAGDVKPLTAADLRSRLLTPADLPAGYSRSAATEDSARLEADNAECERFLNADEDPNIAADVEADFQKSDSGPFLFESLASYKTIELAEQDFTRGRSLLRRCGPLRLSDEGVKGVMTLQERPAADHGDDTLAYTLSGDVTTQGVIVPIDGDIVIVRLGGSAVTLAHLTIGSAARLTVDDLAGAAVKRFRTPRGS